MIQIGKVLNYEEDGRNDALLGCWVDLDEVLRYEFISAKKNHQSRLKSVTRTACELGALGAHP